MELEVVEYSGNFQPDAAGTGVAAYWETPRRDAMMENDLFIFIFK